MTLLIPLLAFVFVSLLVMAAGMMIMSSGTVTIEQRLGEVTGTTPRVADSGYEKAVVDGLKRLGNLVPKSPAEMGKLRLQLVTAGYRGSEALIVFFGMRVTLAVVAFALFATPIIFSRPNFIMALGACGIGYLLPTMLLKRIAARRRHRMRLGLPDTLDLLVVSVEAGLGLDQAIMRVSEELAFAHPDLSSEMRLINLELRAGKARSEALRNFADRTGVDDISSLVTMLIQTDKFGTSVAQSLRVHSDVMRTKRRQRAEEAAAKTGVKMVFPLVFCIFPAIWVVTIGPAAIKFVQVLFPMAQN